MITEIKQEIEALKALGWGITRGEDSDEEQPTITKINGWRIFSECGGLVAEKRSVSGIVTIAVDCYGLKLDPKNIIKQTRSALRKIQKTKPQQLSLF